MKRSTWPLLCATASSSIWKLHLFVFGMALCLYCSWSRTEGTSIDTSSSSFILPARSLHTHSVSFIPRSPGQLCIKGCVIKFSACRAQEFPLLCERSGREKETWYDKRGGEIKVNRIGMGFPKWSDATQSPKPSSNGIEQDSFWRKRTVDAVVHPPQPLLVLENSSSRDSCIMLLEGET
jgi:hypothetical protein